MTAEQQRIKIAEACGWKTETRRAMGYGGVTNAIQYYWEKNGCIDTLPDYCNDLNAMHTVEQSLTDEMKREYIKQLVAVVNESEWSKWPTAHATATQRAEAFLRTLDKWEDAP